ncbi:structural maintenance of chromosomes protein 2-like [Calliphora vicina]|uniref:structural maintenance of chromosomes protein 2-like n=1 Tax=Calliphora vicina TaxID=7373 RepID=UPI00325AEDA8
MQFHLKTNIINTLIAILLFFNKFHKTNGNSDPNEFDSTSRDLTGEMDILKNNLRRVNFDLDALHGKLHLQSDMVNTIKTQILNSDTDKDQCETSELFDELDNKLHKVKQNLQKLINENDDTHLDKMDSILQKVKWLKDCGEENDTAQLQDIKTQINQKLQAVDQYIQRLEILEGRFEKLVDPSENDTSIIEYNNNNKLPDLDNIINEINRKLSSQEVQLQQFEEHLSEMQNISSAVETHLKRKKQKSKCLKCALYRLIEMDKSLNITKID